MGVEEDCESEDPAQPLLRVFLRSTEVTAAQGALERLLRDHAEPVIRRITSSREIGDAEDACSMVRVQLISRLRALRQGPASIASFPAYVAAITHNCCNQLLRALYPEYRRLKSRVRYLLTHRSQFILWENGPREWLCALAPSTVQAPGQTRSPNEGRFDADSFVASLGPGASVATMQLEELATAVLSWGAAPMPLEELVKAAAELQGVGQRFARRSSGCHEDGTNVGDLLSDGSVDVASQLELRSDLKGLWREIGLLPRPQRVALLLNLRDAYQCDALILLPLTGVASLRDIAAALELSVEELTSLWNRLPLDDQTLAQRLGLSRQQVINLRKSARERLVRRVASLQKSAATPLSKQ